MKQSSKPLACKTVAGYAALLLSAWAAPAMAAEAPLRTMTPIYAAPPSGPPPPVFQKCTGPARPIAPNEVFNLTCTVVSPLGGDKILVLPEMWTPGNGCIATTDKPRVILVGNNYSVTANFTNRCGGGYMGTEGGLGWLIFQVQ